jgi:acyl carrier protein
LGKTQAQGCPKQNALSKEIQIMKDIYQRVVKAIGDTFPEAQGTKFTPDSVLGDLPEWDSMAAVNLQTTLQEKFEIEVPLELLSDETKLEEIAEFINNPIGMNA